VVHRQLKQWQLQILATQGSGFSAHFQRQEISFLGRVNVCPNDEGPRPFRESEQMIFVLPVVKAVRIDFAAVDMMSDVDFHDGLPFRWGYKNLVIPRTVLSSKRLTNAVVSATKCR
jgi:hypothetical protein